MSPVEGKHLQKRRLFIISWFLIIMRKPKAKKKKVEAFPIETVLTWLLSVWAGSLECSLSSPPGRGSDGWGWGLSDAPACHTLYTLDERRVPFHTLCNVHISAPTGCTWSRITGQQEVKLLPVSSRLLQPRFQHHLNVENTILDPLQINFWTKHETVWWKTRIYTGNSIGALISWPLDGSKTQKCIDCNKL